MQRIMIIGQPGSGKSTLARALADLTQLPVFHMDQIHWKSGWIERDRCEKTRMCREVYRRDQWIFEGGHSATWAERLDRCDTVIWLDVPLATRLWRVACRTARDFGHTRPDLPEGCPEQFSWEFYTYIWRSRISARRKIIRLISDTPPEKEVIILRKSKDVTAFLDRITRAAPATE